MYAKLRIELLGFWCFPPQPSKDYTHHFLTAQVPETELWAQFQP